MDEDPNRGSGSPPPVPPPPSPPPPPIAPGEQPPQAALPPRGLGDILGSAFEIYGKNAGQLVLIVAVVVVPLSVLSFLITHFAFAATKKTLTIGTSSITITQSRSVAAGLFAAVVTAAISIIIGAILQAAILRAAAQATIGDPVDVEASYKWGLRRFGSVLLVSIMVGISVAIGFILLVIPGIILLVLFAVSVLAVVVENARGTEALRRSWDLAKNHFWHVLGVIVVAALIGGAATGILSAIGGSNSAVRLILQIIGQILVAPFSALVSVLLYLDLRASSEQLTQMGYVRNWPLHD